MKILLRTILALGLLCALGAAERPPAEIFVAPPKVRMPKLSPDGQSYGFVERAGDDMEFITVVDLASRTPRRAATFKDLTVANYWWKGNGMILVLVESLTGNRDWRAFDLKTNETFQLHLFNTNASEMINPLVDEPETILVSFHTGNESDLRRFNIRTGKSVIVQPDVLGVFRWLTDRAGNAVAGLGREEKKWFISFPEPSGKLWRKVPLGEKQMPDVWPVCVAPDQKRVLCLDNTSPETRQVIAWTPANDAREVVWQTPEVDLDLFLVWGDDMSFVRGLLYETDRPRVHYLTPADDALAKSLDAALPNTFNAIVSTSADESKMIIKSYSDVLPEWYYLLDRKAGKMAQLGSAHPEIDAKQMAPSRYFTFKARDGMELHGRIHLPENSKKPLPALLVVAGNSFDLRARFGFDYYAQFLASRGYAMVEIDHRGTDGYGRTLREAGTKQIAGTMVDDLADGIRWLIAEGLVDPQRIGVQGWGRAGLMVPPAVIRYPDLFKVWVSFHTPMTASSLNFNDVVFGNYTEKDTEARMGGYNAGKKYLTSLDLVPQMSRINVPSSHFYTQGQVDNDGSEYATSIPRILKGLPQPHVLVKGTLVRTIADFYESWAPRNRADSARAYTELAVFLDKYLVPAK